MRRYSTCGRRSPTRRPGRTGDIVDWEKFGSNVVKVPSLHPSARAVKD
jgi:hypothetical protein